MLAAGWPMASSGEKRLRDRSEHAGVAVKSRRNPQVDSYMSSKCSLRGEKPTMSSRLKNIAIVVGTVLVAGSCISTTGCTYGFDHGTKVTQEQLLQLKIRETTESEIVALLGRPDFVSIGENDTRQWMYHNISSRMKGNPLLLYWDGKNKTERTQVTLVLNKDGVLVDIVGTETKEERQNIDVFRQTYE